MSNLDLWRKNGPFFDVDHWMNQFFGGEPTARWPAEMKKAVTAKCEVSETPQNYLLKFEIPGLRKEDIKIDLHDNRLTVSGERQEEKKGDTDHKVHYSELSYGSFMRSYSFPTSVDNEKVEAKYDGGILTVSVAKTAANRPRQIIVK